MSAPISPSSRDQSSVSDGAGLIGGFDGERDIRRAWVYARAAAWIAGADRWSEATWRDLEQQLGADDQKPCAADAPESRQEPTAGFVRRRRVHGRRVITPSYLR